MPAHHDLIVTADSARNLAELRLLDESGVQVASRSVDFDSIRISRKQALFDLRSYLRLYVETGHEEEEVARVGVFLAEEVLGEEIFLRLWRPISQRHLRIQLPGATAEKNPLGAALTRIPWEIARPSPARETLAERNLLIRVVHDMQEPPSQPIDLGQDGSLRVLYVSATARRSQPLSTRRERRDLQQMFEREVYPHRKVMVDFLAHGVTREQLGEQVKARSGYHVVHWSGHGHRDRLELAGVRGLPDTISGQELVELFAKAGGFLPRLFVLSACSSGDVEQVKDWQSFLATARGEEPGTRAAFKDLPERDIEIVEQPGYTGMAHALLQGGVPSVLAMRYAIGDEYARALALELHRSLFADTDPKSAVAALTMARKALLAKGWPDAGRYTAADHATPVLYGAEDPGLQWSNERSPSLDIRDRRLHRIAELTLADHPSFVGRGWELTNLGTSFISTARSVDAKPVALITGLGGMGKTALAAEAFDLWNQRFEWVLLYQAKPNALSLDSTLRDFHLRLYAERGRYYRHVQARPADAIHREAESVFTGPDRIVRLTQNLVRALRDEAILLVLDNFEANLKPEQEPGDSAEPLWACQDPDWDHFLALLATELVGAPSRVLITCRRQLAALAGEAAPHCLRVRLQPLPAGEAALYLREHTGLSRMIFGRDEAEKALAERLLQASRFHPLLMDRLARLATGGPELRKQLLAALDAIEKNQDATKLPEIFATERGNAGEIAYLEDALATSIDELIRGTNPEARRLLWMVAMANEPINLGLLKGVWSGESLEEAQLREIKQLLSMLPLLSPELQAELQALPPELSARLNALPPDRTTPDLAPSLAQLVAVGLIMEEHAEEEESDLSCHELVRERILAWMANPEYVDFTDLSETAVRLAYAERLACAFKALSHKDMARALEAGRRALIYCIQAHAWDRLRDFASDVVIGSEPTLLEKLIPHLKAAADVAPKGEPRWRCLTYFADAMLRAGRPDASSSLYEQAAAEAREATSAQGDSSRRAWSDLGTILGNWAGAYLFIKDLNSARRCQLESADAKRKGGSPEIEIIASELEAFRIDLMQGRTTEILPQVERRLARLESWWQKQRAGHDVPEAPYAEDLGRLLISGLDIAADAHFAQREWELALHRLDSILEVERGMEHTAEDIADTRMNRAIVLVRLGRSEEAKVELESCLEIFWNDPTRSARTLGTLASVFDEQDDLSQAIELEQRALALREQFPDPGERAISHNNLAVYLEKRGYPEDQIKSPRHQLAALIYQLIAGLGQHLRTSMGKFAFDFRRAHAAGTELSIPRVAELLADPLFRPLEAWLRDRGAKAEDLQANLDLFMDRMKEATLTSELTDRSAPDARAAPQARSGR